MVRVLVMLGILAAVIGLIEYLYLNGFDVIGLW